MSYNEFHNDADDEYMNDYVQPTSDSDDDDIQSHVSKHSVSSRKKSSKKFAETYDPVTHGCVCIRNPIKKLGITRINAYYTSNTTGAPIRNAVTGVYESDYLGRTKCGVGSIWEDLFFKVIITTTKDGPHTLFYDSPEQYNRHMETRVSDDTMQKWYPKYQYAASQLKIDQDNLENRGITEIH
jgi:hypothetical protein